MTDEEKSDLLWNATNISYAGSDGLFEFVDALIDKAREEAYQEGADYEEHYGT